MSGSVLHFALRETLRHFRDARVLAAMALVAAIMGFAGPFGTFEVLPTAPRLAYWATVVVATYGIGFFVAAVAERFLPIRPRMLRIPLVGLLMAPPVTAAVIAVNWLSFGASQPMEWLSLFAYCAVIAVGVTAMNELVATSLQRASSEGNAASAEAPSSDTVPCTVPILERVPVHQRGNLVSISVSDHYVEVVTTKGRSLVLMRFGDATREVGTTPGLQIHRSHWIALDAVADVTRQGGRIGVALKDGRSLPVSRTYMADAKRAGLVT